MILAAGHGTRLRPLTEELPKPLVPIGDRPLLRHVVEALRGAGFGPLVANAHHLAELMVGAGRDLDVEVVCERSILGTGGGVRHASEALGRGDVLVVNGDIVADTDFEALARRHGESGSFATLAVTRRGPAGAGTVGLDERGEVVRLRGQRFGHETAGAEFVGTQLLSEDARAALPREGCLVGDLYLPALRRGSRLLAAEVVSRFADIGTPASYLAENLAWLERSDLASFVGDELPREVEAHRALVGARARVTGRGALTEVVVWPGASVEAPLARAVVTPRRVLPLAAL
ncbi:MAG: nucleotidyltransferase family protein [Deltaproteobacteria bacterium]|nr:nucleotidyltransferase family protein [Deltaproteobacteria bacterium]